MASLWKHPQSPFWVGCFTVHSASGAGAVEAQLENDRSHEFIESLLSVGALAEGNFKARLERMHNEFVPLGRDL